MVSPPQYPRFVVALVAIALAEIAFASGCAPHRSAARPGPAARPTGVVQIATQPDSLRAEPEPLPTRWWDALDARGLHVPLLVATTRAAVPGARPGLALGSGDADALAFAVAAVSLPSYRARADGATPRPVHAARPDPSRELFVSALEPVDSARFVQRLRERFDQSGSREVLVYVHGYNKSFELAAARLAQVVADIGFDGTAVLFSWPSADHIRDYVRDQQAARNAGFHLLRLIRDVIPSAGPVTVHILVHSMGAEVLGKALMLAEEGARPPRLGQVILAAPDIDVRTFDREILPVLRTRTDAITLYASAHDEALRASRVLNGDWRLGLGGDSLTVRDGMTTIDASRLHGESLSRRLSEGARLRVGIRDALVDALGHDLFDNPTLLADLHALLVERQSPERRRLLQVRRGDGTVFWRFR